MCSFFLSLFFLSCARPFEQPLRNKHIFSTVCAVHMFYLVFIIVKFYGRTAKDDTTRMKILCSHKIKSKLETILKKIYESFTCYDTAHLCAPTTTSQSMLLTPTFGKKAHDFKCDITPIPIFRHNLINFLIEKWTPMRADRRWAFFASSVFVAMRFVFLFKKNAEMVLIKMWLKTQYHWNLICNKTIPAKTKLNL